MIGTPIQPRSPAMTSNPVDPRQPEVEDDDVGMPAGGQLQRLLPRRGEVNLVAADAQVLIRAALEGVCQQLALVLQSMREAGNEVREIRATGGFARSPLWRQMLTDTLGTDVGFPAGHDGSSFGVLGMQALGLVESIDVAAELVRIQQTTTPTLARRRRTAGCCPCSPRCTTRSCRPSRP
jgi:sugar (pentulose or hexulose) kinase